MENISQSASISELIVNKIAIGDAETDVISTLGKPLSIDSYQNIRVLQYDSVSPTLASYVYTEQGKVVSKSVSFFQNENKPTLQEFVARFGNPSESRFDSLIPERDSFRLVVSIWPEKGFAITSSDVQKDSVVVNVNQFVPISKELYFSTWGKRLAENKTTTLQFVSEKTQPVYTNIGISAAAVIGICIILVIVAYLKRRKKQSISIEQR